MARKKEKKAAKVLLGKIEKAAKTFQKNTNKNQM